QCLWPGRRGVLRSEDPELTFIGLDGDTAVVVEVDSPVALVGIEVDAAVLLVETDDTITFIGVEHDAVLAETDDTIAIVGVEHDATVFFVEVQSKVALPG
ncbi:hypothetical protein N9I50_00200, partial [bacterium]|nr:hypothetical protein [bacterium]